jgi:uncharacterized protein YegL
MTERVLPFYLVVDQSASLGGSPIATINMALRELHRTVTENPAAEHSAQLGIIGFSDTARTILPLSDLQAISEIPALEAYGSTVYSNAFELLHGEIESDVHRLKADGGTVYRPVVFFVSDGQPTDGTSWRDSYSRLMNSTRHPKIVAFGIGSADPAVLAEMGPQ